jgi:hypothetical protein
MGVGHRDTQSTESVGLDTLGPSSEEVVKEVTSKKGPVDKKPVKDIKGQAESSDLSASEDPVDKKQVESSDLSASDGPVDPQLVKKIKELKDELKKLKAQAGGRYY